MLPENNVSRYMAIDYGLKRIGLALSDPLFTFAYPFRTIENNSRAVNEIQKIADQKKVVKIILGNPLREDGTASKLSGIIEEFRKTLESKMKIEVILMDERYSSLTAKEKIIESVTKKSKRRDKGLLDSSSAAVILQDYLDQRTK